MMLEKMAKNLVLLEVEGSPRLKTRNAPMIVASSAAHFMNPLKGFRNEMITREMKQVPAPGNNPKKKYVITMGIPTTSNLKVGNSGNGILKNRDISNMAMTEPKIAVPLMSTLIRSV